MEDLEMEDLEMEALERWHEEGKPFVEDLTAALNKYAGKISHSSIAYTTACLLAAYVDNLADDPEEMNDPAGEYPERLEEMVAMWLQYKTDNEVVQLHIHC